MIRTGLTRDQEPSSEQMERISGNNTRPEAPQRDNLKKYKVLASRHDVPEHIVATLEVATDGEARYQFEKFKDNPQHTWDWLTLVRYEETVVETW